MSTRGLWEIQTEETINVRFGDYDTETWKPVRVDKLLVGWEKTNNDKPGQACYDQIRNFITFTSQWMGRWEIRH